MESKQKGLDAAILAGKLLMESGGEMHRVEDTMARIANHANQHLDSISFVLPTGIFVSDENGRDTRLRRIHFRATQLNTLTQVNALSRRFVEGDIDLDTLLYELKRIEENPQSISFPKRLIAYGLGSVAMMFIFHGHLQDAPITFLLACMAGFIHEKSRTLLKMRFINDLLTAFILSFLINQLSTANILVQINAVTMASVVMFVPGIPIMHSLRDFFLGNTVSGSVFLLEAFFTALMIGLGVILGLSL